MKNKIIIGVVVFLVIFVVIYFMSGSKNTGEGLLNKSSASEMYNLIHKDMKNGMTFSEFKKKTGMDDSGAYLALRKIYKTKKSVSYHDYINSF